MTIDPGLIATIGGIIVTAQLGILAYCIKIEHRLTKLETIVSIRRNLWGKQQET
jgi:hypothetical protein